MIVDGRGCCRAASVVARLFKENERRREREVMRERRTLSVARKNTSLEKLPPTRVPSESRRPLFSSIVRQRRLQACDAIIVTHETVAHQQANADSCRRSFEDQIGFWCRVTTTVTAAGILSKTRKTFGILVSLEPSITIQSWEIYSWRNDMN